MNFDDLITRFLGDLQIRNYSARTVAEYGYSLRALAHFLEQRHLTDLQSVTTATEMQQAIMVGSTVSGIASVILVFFLIGRGGLWGSTVAILAGQVVMLVTMMWYSVPRWKRVWPELAAP